MATIGWVVVVVKVWLFHAVSTLHAEFAKIKYKYKFNNP